ncbi:MAG: phosphoribosylformylglycinamidine synthase subunit PurL [Pseudomonadota bacterium]
MKITDQIVKDHGLTPDEYERIKRILGREPNITELGVFSVMWSEHCSYKSSKIYLKNLPTKGEHVVQGPGENAGAIDIGEGNIIIFKIESHNHPSFIEPYQGAATGVGGILRDIFTMGARPIANMNSLRFGDVDHPKTPYLLKGVVSGVGDYGNTMGIPTVGGEVQFNSCYNGNILVNAFTLGILKGRMPFTGKASGVGNPVIYVGSKTGRDGIHGATMASQEFNEATEEKRPTVQVGDPFTEKRLLEACLELMKKDYIIGIQDMGAAGLTCSTFEMADRGEVGMKIDLNLVPQRELNMTPYEIMLSESQERMLIVAKQGFEEKVIDIFKKWDLDAAMIGEVVGNRKIEAIHNGEKVLEIPVSPIVCEAPVYKRAVAMPDYQEEKQQLNSSDVPVPKDMTQTLKRLIFHPNLARKSWVWEQYDHMVMTNTVLHPGGDAAVIRLKGSKRGIVLSCDANPKYCFLDPYNGGAHAVAEAARNISAVGGRPLAISNCLNFGSPEDPGVMWQFQQVTAGMSDACKIFNTPVTGGNVSFYNETFGKAIYPTPVITMVGVVDDVDKACSQGWKAQDDAIILLGYFEPELGATEYLERIHGVVKGLAPVLDLERERLTQHVCRTAISRGLIRSAHDLSEGGLAVALAECSLLSESKYGSAVVINGVKRVDQLLFGETASTLIVSTPPEDLAMLMEIAQTEGVPAQVIGRVGSDKLTIGNHINVSVSELYEGWSTAYEKIF